MENPATWNKATQVISDALGEAERQRQQGIFGHSPARIVHDALEREGLVSQNGGWISVERRKPPTGSPCWIVWANTVQTAAYRRLGKGYACADGYEWWFGLGDPIPDEEVTHWQPLPAAPNVSQPPTPVHDNQEEK